MSEPVRIQVHDELTQSVPDREITKQVAEILRDAVKLKVPIKVDIAFGKNWGGARD